MRRREGEREREREKEREGSREGERERDRGRKSDPNLLYSLVRLKSNIWYA